MLLSHAAPGTQLVTYEFRLDWSTYLASSHSIVVASFDGRGSGGRGERFLHEIYRRLGTVEVQDQIKGARCLNATPLSSIGLLSSIAPSILYSFLCSFFLRSSLSFSYSFLHSSCLHPFLTYFITSFSLLSWWLFPGYVVKNNAWIGFWGHFHWFWASYFYAF